jgi:hypothetical protein
VARRERRTRREKGEHRVREEAAYLLLIIQKLQTARNAPVTASLQFQRRVVGLIAHQQPATGWVRMKHLWTASVVSTE